MRQETNVITRMMMIQRLADLTPDFVELEQRSPRPASSRAGFEITSDSTKSRGEHTFYTLFYFVGLLTQLHRFCDDE